MAYDGTKLQALGSTLDNTHTEWVYRSQDAIATVIAAGYFADGCKKLTGKGMKLGDEVKIIVTDGSDNVTARGNRWVSVANATTGAVTAAGAFT